jgi:hypothetical protein
MGMDNEAKRLREIYAEQSDEDLLELHQEREDLTQVAQDALAQVMKDRGLAQQTSNDKKSGSPASNPDLRGDVLSEDETVVYLFHDAFQAREAMRHMEGAEVDHRIVDWHVVDPERPIHPSGLDLALVVHRKMAGKAASVLHEKLGLFPSHEEGGESGGPLNPVEGLTFLAMFDLHEALIAAQALGEAGISYLWRDGRDETNELPDEETVAIEVRQSKLEEATALIERRFAALSE